MREGLSSLNTISNKKKKMTLKCCSQKKKKKQKKQQKTNPLYEFISMINLLCASSSLVIRRQLQSPCFRAVSVYSSR